MTRARVLPTTFENLALAAAELRGGALVAMPTETVYGLAANAFDEAAVARVFAVKERPTFDPLIVHVAPFSEDADAVMELARLGVVDFSAIDESTHKRVNELARALWPGPLTLVLPRGSAIPDLVTSGLDTVAVRMPRHPAAQSLIRLTGSPLAAPSANRFGRISPTSAADVVAELGDRIAIILDGGACEVGVESTVLALMRGATPVILRPGGVTRESIERVIGKVDWSANSPGDSAGQGARSPGTLASHYAPRTPLFLLSGRAEDEPSERFDVGNRGAIGLLLLSGRPTELAARIAGETGQRVTAISLSEDGDRQHAARQLFAGLRELDGSGAEAIFAESCQDESGLGFAIADRLRRAAAR